MDSNTKQSGQILLITLLVMAIAVTLALSIIGRATTDVTMSNDIEESTRAFNAAEAGIEEALRTGQNVDLKVLSGNDVSYQASVSTIGAAVGVYVFPQVTLKNSTDQVWLVGHNADGTLDTSTEYAGNSVDVCWSATSPAPAVVAAVLYSRAGAYNVARVALDPDSTRALTNKFINAGVSYGSYCGMPNVYKYTLTFNSLGILGTDTLLALRTRAVYSESQMAVDTTPAGVQIPEQGKKIDSVGKTETGLERKITVYQQYRYPSSIFDAAVFSQTTFVK